MFNLTALGIVSLPDFRRINFNPEALYGKLLLPGLVEALAEGAEDDPFSDVAPELTVFAFGAFDYSALFHDILDEELDLAAQVRTLHEIGFDGVKMWAGKPSFQARTGLRLDAPTYRGAFDEAGRLGMPIVVHVADPPRWWRADSGSRYIGPGMPAFEELQRQASAVCELHPETTFIFPHLLFLAGDLPRLYRFMQSHPNAVLDLAPGDYLYGELYSHYEDARAFLRNFSRRVFFGTNGRWFPEHLEQLPQRGTLANAEATRRLLRFLTSNGEIDNPYEPTRPQLPTLRGLRLPEPVLDAVFYQSFGDLMAGRAAALNLGPEQAGPEQAGRVQAGTTGTGGVDGYLAQFTERLSAIGGDPADIDALQHIRGECRRRASPEKSAPPAEASESDGAERGGEGRRAVRKARRRRRRS